MIPEVKVLAQLTKNEEKLYFRAVNRNQLCEHLSDEEQIFGGFFMSDFSKAKLLLKRSAEAALLSLSMATAGGAATLAQDASKVTGVLTSYGAALNSDSGSGVYMPADSETACKNASIAHYLLSNSGGWNMSAWTLCLGPENHPLHMYRCDADSCSVYKDYSSAGYASHSPR
jgi:hypothetical protein